jgi:membrane-associated phospholipid phosphatase
MNYPNQNLLYRNFAFCLLFFVPLVLLPKGTLVQEINLFEYPSLFPFFKWITLLGDGWILLLVFISLLAYYFQSKTSMSRDNLMNFLFSSLFMILVVTLMKNVFFYAFPRPIKYFEIELSQSLLAIYDMNFHQIRSFPSGHTATISVVGFYLMRFFKSEIIRRALFLVILVGGFSRIFLFQHFVTDVLAGLGLGLIAVLFGNYITYWLYYRKSKLNTPTTINASE